MVEQWTKRASPFVFLLSVVLVSQACVGRDLRILCKTFEEAEATTVGEPVSLADVSPILNERLSRFGDVRDAIEDVAMMGRADYALFLEFAAAAGQPEWRCPAMQRAMEPVGAQATGKTEPISPPAHDSDAVQQAIADVLASQGPSAGRQECGSHRQPLAHSR